MRRYLQAALAFGLVLGGAARAQTASQTWVSGVGDDANPCTRTAPCLSFGAALTATDSGGEIVVLDPGDFAPVTINKAITLTAASGAITANLALALTVN